MGLTGGTIRVMTGRNFGTMESGLQSCSHPVSYRSSYLSSLWSYPHPSSDSSHHRVSLYQDVYNLMYRNNGNETVDDQISNVFFLFHFWSVQSLQNFIFHQPLWSSVPENWVLNLFFLEGFEKLELNHYLKNERIFSLSVWEWRDVQSMSGVKRDTHIRLLFSSRFITS